MKFALLPPGLNLYPPKADFWWRDISTDQMVAFAQRADALGYDYITVSWHIGLSEKMAAELGPRWVHAPTAASFILGATSRIKVICLLVVPCHDPVELAKIIATLDFLSGGRIVPVMMAGYQPWEFALLHRPWDSRAAVTDESIEAMRELWTSEIASYHGQFIQFEGVVFEPKPARRPLPIWGGGSAKSALRRIARHADGWLGPGLPREAIRPSIEFIQSQPEFLARPRTLDVEVPLFEGLRDQVTHELLAPPRIRMEREAILEQLHEIAQLGATVTHAADIVGGGLFQDAPGVLPQPRDLAEQLERLEWFAAEILPAGKEIGHTSAAP